MKKIQVSIGIAAFNEEENIGSMLRSLSGQSLTSVIITEIIIISSGSTDNTDQIISSYIKKDKRVKLYIEPKRLGKASAVNVILQKAKEDIIILCGADLILDKNCVNELIKPFFHKSTGITGSRPVPLNNPDSFFGFASRLIWDLHHLTALKTPKMGECIAFRKIFKQIHVLAAVDEVNIESLIRGQGYKAVYVPEAIVYNKGPENLSDFISSRRRIYCGHLTTLRELSYEVSTINSLATFLLLIKNLKADWQYLIWTPAVIALEVYSRMLGYIDYKLHPHSHTVWKSIRSTKNLAAFQPQNVK